MGEATILLDRARLAAATADGTAADLALAEAQRIYRAIGMGDVADSVDAEFAARDADVS